MTEALENIVEETMPEEKIIERKNPFCVISIDTFGEYATYDIQTNSSWTSNPYENYAVVPDEMVEAIMETCGFCDITLNEEGTEVVSFVAREIPDIPEPEPEPAPEDVTWGSMAEAITEGVNEV